jgi:D-3-phosphoglycerate dehydrogenase
MIPEEKEILTGLSACVIEAEEPTSNESSSWLPMADAVIVVGAHLPGSVIHRLRRCKVLSRLGTGLDNIDVDQATLQGILVTNVPDFATDEVADHTMALLLASVRQLKAYETSARSGRRIHLTLPLVHRLSALTLGIVGYGSIGKAVAQRAAGFGMRILVHDAYQNVGPSAGVVSVDYDTLLRESDVVSLHCPLTDETRHMVTLRELELMKSSSILINTARGHIVRESDLVHALQSGTIAYAALDVFGEVNVFDQEGFATDHPLWTLPNVLLTPHCSAHSVEALRNGRIGAARAVADVLNDEWPRNLVNPGVVPWFALPGKQDIDRRSRSSMRDTVGTCSSDPR